MISNLYPPIVFGGYEILCAQVTEVQNAQNRMRNDSNFQREECARLRQNINDAREKLNDLEEKVATLHMTTTLNNTCRMLDSSNK